MKKSSKKVESKNTDEAATTTAVEGVTQAEGTTKVKPNRKGGKSKKTLTAITIEPEKDEVAEFRDMAKKETLPGVEENERSLMADLEVLRSRIVARQGSSIERDDADGEDIYEFDQAYRKGRRKMPNGQSTFKLVASCKGVGVDDKQCRRLSNRWGSILKIRELGVIEPRLGVSHYDVVKSLKTLEAKLEALRDAEVNNLSVAELRTKYIKAKEPVQKGWKELLHSLAADTSEHLIAIHDLMEKQGGSPDDDVLCWIDDIVVAANSFTTSAKEVA